MKNKLKQLFHFLSQIVREDNSKNVGSIALLIHYFYDCCREKVVQW